MYTRIPFFGVLYRYSAVGSSAFNRRLFACFRLAFVFISNPQLRLYFWHFYLSEELKTRLGERRRRRRLVRSSSRLHHLERDSHKLNDFIFVLFHIFAFLFYYYYFIYHLRIICRCNSERCGLVLIPIALFEGWRWNNALWYRYRISPCIAYDIYRFTFATYKRYRWTSSWVAIKLFFIDSKPWQLG